MVWEQNILVLLLFIIVKKIIFVVLLVSQFSLVSYDRYTNLLPHKCRSKYAKLEDGFIEFSIIISFLIASKIALLLNVTSFYKFFLQNHWSPTNWNK